MISTRSWVRARGIGMVPRVKGKDGGQVRGGEYEREGTGSGIRCQG